MKIQYYESTAEVYYFVGEDFEVSTRASTKTEAVAKLRKIGFRVNQKRFK